MPDSRNDFGMVSRINAETFGEPGKRTFRVLAVNSDRAAALWMEKQVLNALGEYIQAQLRRSRDAGTLRNLTGPDPGSGFEGNPDLDFQVAQLAMGYEGDGRFTFYAYAPGDDEENPSFACHATAGQVEALAEEISRVVSAGRPLCPLCGVPMDASGHACIRANGHSKQAIPPLRQDDE